MIASVRGVLSYKSPSYIIVETGGIGYQIFTSASSYQGLPEIGGTVTLSIYTYVREDALNLYGFLSREEKDLFMLLLNVSGVGPKLSLNILSGISGSDLVSSIRGDDIVRLTSIPGIGKKMASRLIFELKEKIGDLFSIGYAATADETRKEER
ncbi:MAG: Holliday junction branch migration protein RuvA, partial [Nitrospirota bacterium]